MDEAPREVARMAGEDSGAPAGSITVAPSYSPLRSEDALDLDVGDGLVIYSGDSTLVHHLNPTAALVWQLCGGEATVAELAGEIAEEYGVDRLTAEQQIAELIGELDALGLVRDAGEELDRSADDPRT